MHIVHYIPGIRLEQGGVVRAVLDWCNVFSRRGHQITLIAYQANDIPPEWFSGESTHPRAVVVPEPTLPGRPLSRRAMQIVTETLRGADVVHLHSPWLDGNRQIGKIARRMKIPYIVTLHGMLNDWTMKKRSWKKPLYMSLFGTRFLNRAAVIHCTAQGERLQAAKWFSNPNVTVLPYLIDLQPFEKLPGPEAALALIPAQHREKSKILFLSRLHEQKGIDILIRVAAMLRDSDPNFILLVAGTGQPEYERQLHDLVTELNLTDQTVFLGLITGQQKISLYQAADLFVLPTRQENFGLVLTESLAAGTPVVTTKETDIWPEIQKAGGTIAEGSSQSIAAAITLLLNEKADLRERGERGRSWVFTNLSTDSLAAKYEQVYRGAREGLGNGHEM